MASLLCSYQRFSLNAQWGTGQDLAGKHSFSLGLPLGFISLWFVCQPGPKLYSSFMPGHVGPRKGWQWVCAECPWCAKSKMGPRCGWRGAKVTEEDCGCRLVLDHLLDPLCHRKHQSNNSNRKCPGAANVALLTE